MSKHFRAKNFVSDWQEDLPMENLAVFKHSSRLSRSGCKRIQKRLHSPEECFCPDAKKHERHIRQKNHIPQ